MNEERRANLYSELKSTYLYGRPSNESEIYGSIVNAAPAARFNKRDLHTSSDSVSYFSLDYRSYLPIV